MGYMIRLKLSEVRFLVQSDYAGWITSSAFAVGFEKKTTKLSR